MAPKSLITLVRDRIFSAIRSVQPPSRWKVLVLDGYTSELISSVTKMHDILQESVTGVEAIEQTDRQEQPAFEACYILCPTVANIDAIIQDLAPGGDPSRGRYAAAHIFFVDGLSDQLIQRLTRSPAEPKLRQLIELFCNISTPESQVFSLRNPHSFYTIFQPLSSRPFNEMSAAQRAIDDEIEVAAQALLNVCVTLNEFPQIRYYNPSHPPLGALAPPDAAAGPSSTPANGGLYTGRLARFQDGGSHAPSGDHFTKRLAFRVQAAIDDYVRDNQPKPDPGRPKGMLFITDRSMDIAAPFLHEFSYQAMCNDLLEIENGLRYHYRFMNAHGEEEEKEAVLSDEDSVWCAIRHMHIAEAIQKLTDDFKEHAGRQGQFETGTSLNDMRDMLASLPHMQEMKEKLSLHLTMAQNCMNIFERTKLSAQANVEQCCATRMTADGSKPKTLVEEMVPLLDDRGVTNADKVRIIALYIMYSDGVPDEDRKRLFQHARLGLHEMDAVNNLVMLGARVVKQPMTSAWDTWFKKTGARKQPYREGDFELSRYQPQLKLALEDHCAGRLEQSTWPYVRDAPPDTSGLVNQASSVGTSALARVGLNTASSSTSNSPNRPAASSLRSAKPTWHQKPRVGAAAGPGSAGGGALATAFSRDDATRQRFIVFVAGGTTYSEIRAAYQSTASIGKDVYLGSSHIFTPSAWIESLAHLSQGPPRRHDHHHRHAAAPAHHYPGGPALPPGASLLSKPSNEMSRLRARSDQARDGPPQSNGGYMPRGGHQQHDAHDGRYQPPPGQGYAAQGPPPQLQQPRPMQADRAPAAPAASYGSASGQRHLQQADHRSASPALSDLSKASKEKKKGKLGSLFKK